MLTRVREKIHWPPMNADERGFRDAKAFVFLICVYPRSSAAGSVFDYFSGAELRRRSVIDV
jgi:hypothetical protein